MLLNIISPFQIRKKKRKKKKKESTGKENKGQEYKRKTEGGVEVCWAPTLLFVVVTLVARDLK